MMTAVIVRARGYPQTRMNYDLLDLQVTCIFVRGQMFPLFKSKLAFDRWDRNRFDLLACHISRYFPRLASMGSILNMD